MSSPSNVELKAGHPPAVKAGGMRVATKRPPPADSAAAAETVADLPPAEEVDPAVAPEDGAGKLITNDVVSKGSKDFSPTEAVKVFHEKPQPAVENRPPNTRGAAGNRNIQQPGRRE
ncbi:death-associated protein 1-like [Sycon ciliatum]|uniref:death-associated protein 1-like n=1 Tax=Sycon ciliatum TaxID=27933 RepID=UPI0031F68C1A